MGRPSDARERLLRASRDVIYANSYEAVTVDDFCKAAHVTKSSFYHFFASKQELLLATLDYHWQWLQESLLKPAFADDVPPTERIMRFFDVMLERQRTQKETGGHMRGCPLGNITLEMSTQDELVRSRVEHYFGEWAKYVERALQDAKDEGSVPARLDTVSTAQALLAYFEGVILLAKGRNDPNVMAMLRNGAITLMQCSQPSAA